MRTVKFRSVEFRYENRPEFWEHIDGWEPESFDVLDRFLGPGKSFLDIGAWNGVLSIYAHLIGAEITAVEPDPKAFEEMMNNFNFYEDKIGPSIEGAITDRNGYVNLLNRIGGFGNSETSVLHRYESEQAITINGFTLEKIISVNGLKPDLLKIDTEGAELFIIPSSIQILKELNCPLYLSLHPYWFPNPQDDTDKIIKALAQVYDLTKMEPMIHNQYLFLP